VNPTVRDISALFRPLGLLTLVLVGGTVGYTLIEGLSPLEALYLTATTLSTVGYGDIHPNTDGGRIFTIGLIMVGVGVALFSLTEIARSLYEGQFGYAVGRTRMAQRVKSLRDHFILCGYGRVGRQIADDLQRAGVPFVVVDRDPTGLRQAAERGLAVVEGDAGSDEVLRKAGVAAARGLVAAVAEDADNIYVTLSARSLNAKLMIVARANNDESAAKLERAGADRVVSPYSIGGRRMAMLALRPLSVEFVDSIFHGEASDLLLEEVEVGPGARLAGRTVDEIQSSLAPGVSVLAIRRAAHLVPRPAPETVVQAGDELVVIGAPGQLRTLEGLS
jgi:voltage-gated potassium channel